MSSSMARSMPLLSFCPFVGCAFARTQSTHVSCTEMEVLIISIIVYRHEGQNLHSNGDKCSCSCTTMQSDPNNLLCAIAIEGMQNDPNRTIKQRLFAIN